MSTYYTWVVRKDKMEFPDVCYRNWGEQLIFIGKHLDESMKMVNGCCTGGWEEFDKIMGIRSTT